MTTEASANLGPGLKQAQQCGGCKPGIGRSVNVTRLNTEKCTY